MKIIDILKESALLLGLNEDVTKLNTVTEENEVQSLEENSTIKSLFNLIKFSIRELCTNYVPVSRSINISTNEKKYPLNKFENFIRVQNVFKEDELVKHKIINRNIVLEEDGEYVVNYATYPIIISMFEEVDFLQNFSPDVIVFGLCAYFSLANGMFAEFEEFHENYITKAESLKNLKMFELPSRRWE